MHLDDKYKNKEAKHDPEVQHQSSSDSFHTMIWVFWEESGLWSTGLIKRDGQVFNYSTQSSVILLQQDSKMTRWILQRMW